MWILTNLNKSEYFYLTISKVYTIGKISSEFLIRGDASISRDHARIELATDLQITLQDVGSKYGTFHNSGIENSKRLEKGQIVTLKNGDRIRFGVLKSIWTLSYMPISIIISASPEKDVLATNQCMQQIGGKVLNNWQPDCTHLTMVELKVTLKLLYALLEHIPIVTCNYWQDVVKSVREKTSLPQCKMYIPKWSEVTLSNHKIDFECWQQRRSLFANVTFVFINRSQFEMYNPIISKMSGTCKELHKGLAKSMLIRDDVVVVQHIPSPDSQCSQSLRSVEDFLLLHGRRVIPEFEIGLAIVHCSKTKYCNPCYKIVNDILPNDFDKITGSVLAQNTYESTNQEEMHLADIEATEAASGTMNTRCSLSEAVGDFNVQNTEEVSSKNEKELAHSPQMNMKSPGIILGKTQTIGPVFMDKPQSAKIFTPKPHNLLKTAQSGESKKRDFINVFPDWDKAKDGDLFNFSNKRLRSEPDAKRHCSDKLSESKDTLFQFPTKKANVSGKDESPACKENNAVSIRNIETSFNQKSEPKYLPTMINTKFWLYNSSIKIETKKEEGDETNNKSLNHEHLEWINSLKQGVSIRLVNVVSSCSKSNLENSRSPGCKEPLNFKNFVKNKSYQCIQ